MSVDVENDDADIGEREYMITIGNNTTWCDLLGDNTI